MDWGLAYAGGVLVTAVCFAFDRPRGFDLKDVEKLLFGLCWPAALVAWAVSELRKDLAFRRRGGFPITAAPAQTIRPSVETYAANACQLQAARRGSGGGGPGDGGHRIGVRRVAAAPARAGRYTPGTMTVSPFRSATVSLFAVCTILSAAVPCPAKPAGDPPPGVSRPLVLSPGPDNPRNSEGDFIRLKDGRLLFVYTHFTGQSSSDGAAAHLASRASSDGGKTWTDRDEIVVPREGKLNVMSVSLLRLQDGRIALFYLVKNSADDCRAYLRTSDDEAKTWGEPTLCMPENGYFVVNNNRAVQLKGGRIILPAAQHDRSKDKPGFHRGVAVCFYSDDAGRTWRRGRSALEAPPESRSGLQEPLVVELNDGRLMMLCRTDRGSQFRSYSSDRGDTWTSAEPTDLASPLSPASIARVPKTGHLLLVWNDHTKIDPALRGRRTPLTVAVSRDEGKTWEDRKTLYDHPQGWYCYTAITFVDDRVLLGHCAGFHTRESNGLADTVVTSFDLDWLYGRGGQSP